MQIILNSSDILEFCEILLKNKSLRNLIKDEIDKYEENNEDNEINNIEEILVINSDKIQLKKKRGRPKKTAKNSNLITIENENIDLEI